VKLRGILHNSRAKKGIPKVFISLHARPRIYLEMNVPRNVASMEMEEHSPEVVTALNATIMASELCQKVKMDLTKEGSMLKSDKSPVTIADFGSQAIICKWIKEKFPNDIIVAEEDSTELKRPAHSKIREQVASYVRDFVPNASPKEVCSWIDYSSHFTADRFWTLDPIDGTKGFLRGEQYAIALALIENGLVRLGVMGCPNLHVNQDQPFGQKGVLFLALRGRGSFQMDAEGKQKHPLSVSKLENPAEAFFTESVEANHTDHLFHQLLAQRLNISKPSLRMDSQAKYGIVARGEATFYLRVPSTSEPWYKENIWDHAPGSIIAEEAGGKVTDMLGKPLDFLSGIKMEHNHGIVVTNGLLHDVILKALKM
jgi:3'(2'), 5'-bisphosphate nucleotidase